MKTTLRKAVRGYLESWWLAPLLALFVPTGVWALEMGVLHGPPWVALNAVGVTSLGVVSAVLWQAYQRRWSRALSTMLAFGPALLVWGAPLAWVAQLAPLCGTALGAPPLP